MIRDGKASSGIQLTPRANSRSPLTTRVKPVPCASGEVSSSTVRKPVLRRQESTAPSPSNSVNSTSYNGCSP
ncbi:hypothetical protein SALBM217S_04954 [Streptomyces griseoloalbus]